MQLVIPTFLGGVPVTAALQPAAGSLRLAACGCGWQPAGQRNAMIHSHGIDASCATQRKRAACIQTA